MRKKDFIAEALLILLLPISATLMYLGKFYPEIVETVYSRGIYPVISKPLSLYFSLFSFSAAEILFYCLIFFAAFLLIVALARFLKLRFKAFFSMLLAALSFVSVGCFLFTIMWGLNYDRQPLAKSLGYKVKTPDETELSAVLKQEMESINSLCGKIDFSKTHSYYPGGFNEIRLNVNTGYKALASSGKIENTLFGKNTTHPKAVFASKIMSYIGIEGIFIPFTYEPNVNTDTPEFVQPFDAAHESAHFKGFAREEEANFVAYLADSKNPDPYFQYSAHMMAFIYTANALSMTDSPALQETGAFLDSRAKLDFAYYSEYINLHQSKAQYVSDKINDSYLKSQGQQGIINYDMFVNLLADKYRTEHS